MNRRRKKKDGGKVRSIEKVQKSISEEGKR